MAAALALATPPLVSGAAAAQTSPACTCSAGPDQSTLGDVDVVFSGRLTAANVPATTPTGFEAAIYTFRVDRVFKGRADAASRVYSLASKAACGLADMKAGDSYVVFAIVIQSGSPYRPLGTPDGALYAGGCAGSVHLGPLSGPPAFLGEGRPPGGAVTRATASVRVDGGTVGRPDWLAPMASAALAIVALGVISRLLAGRRRTVL